MIIRNNKELFMKEFKARVEQKPNVQNVQFIGSILTDRWTPGKSDVDIIIHGNINIESKNEIVSLIRDLNYKYDLEIEKSRCCHPTPFFIDNQVKELLFNNLMFGQSELTELGRMMLKDTAPSHEIIWGIEDTVKNIENILPPPFPLPRLSHLIDTLK